MAGCCNMKWYADKKFEDVWNFMNTIGEEKRLDVCQKFELTQVTTISPPVDEKKIVAFKTAIFDEPHMFILIHVGDYYYFVEPVKVGNNSQLHWTSAEDAVRKAIELGHEVYQFDTFGKFVKWLIS